MDTTNQPPPMPPVTPPVRKKRRWWVYVLAAVGVMVLLVIGGIVSVFAYGNHLGKVYTQEKALEIKKVDAKPMHQGRRQRGKNNEPQYTEAQLQLFNKWNGFKTAMESKTPPPPLEITAEDINVLLATFTGGRENLEAFFEDNKLKARFSIPMQNTPFKTFNGRFLNGVATFKIDFTEGMLTAKVDSIHANGKPLPKWLQKRITDQNLAQFWDREYDMLWLYSRLDLIDVQENKLVFIPYMAP